jgi:hypothetical protein
VSFNTHAIIGEVTNRDNNTWWLTKIYGPQSTEAKRNFINELIERRALCLGPWIIAGDFNMIIHASEKNNDNLDHGMMALFRSFVQEQDLKDMYLHGRWYTWSNDRETPMMPRINKVLASTDWDLILPNVVLQALSSSASDHAPIHLSTSASFQPKRRFRSLSWRVLKQQSEMLGFAALRSLTPFRDWMLYSETSVGTCSPRERGSLGMLSCKSQLRTR